MPIAVRFAASMKCPPWFMTNVVCLPWPFMMPKIFFVLSSTVARIWFFDLDSLSPSERYILSTFSLSLWDCSRAETPHTRTILSRRRF